MKIEIWTVTMCLLDHGALSESGPFVALFNDAPTQNDICGMFAGYINQDFHKVAGVLKPMLWKSSDQIKKEVESAPYLSVHQLASGMCISVCKRALNIKGKG